MESNSGDSISFFFLGESAIQCTCKIIMLWKLYIRHNREVFCSSVILQAAQFSQRQDRDRESLCLRFKRKGVEEGKKDDQCDTKQVAQKKRERDER